MSKLNIVFHAISNNPQGDWEVSPDYFIRILEWCEENYPDYHIYIDDGKNLDNISFLLERIALKTTLAIITDDIGKHGYLSWRVLSDLVKMGFKVASHSVSHPSMCAYDLKTGKIISPHIGKYISAPHGKQLISINQIRFQIIESKKALLIHGFNVNEFVFPYGLYSEKTIEILDNTAEYDYYATCDEALYEKGKLVPRILIYGSKTLEENIQCLSNIIGKSN